MKNDIKKYVAEAIGTCVLVLIGCGVAVFSGADLIATSLAFGLAVVAMAYAIGDISGCHINPAVSLAMLITKKINFKQFVGYTLAQILGAFVGSAMLFAILSSCNMPTDNLGANAYGGDMALTACGAFLVETILTFVFVYTILGTTADTKRSHIAGLVIGLSLVLVHLLGIKLTGTSVNPARSIAPAILQGGEPYSQMWLFIVSPLLGGALAAWTYTLLNTNEKKKN